MNRNECLKKVEGLLPVIREYVVQSEQERHLAAPVVTALRDAGMFRLCRPRDLGGLEVDPLTAVDVVERLSYADGAAGWSAMIAGVGGAFEAFVPPAGAKEIFTSPDVVVGGVFAPTGRAVPVDGGYRVSGRWGIASGCQHSDWLGGSSLVFEGAAPRMTPMGPEWIVPMLPASQCKIIDTWSVSGLRGSGSHDFEVKDVFVPADRCIRVPMTAPYYEGKLFAFPFFGLLAAGISATALGVARAAVDEVIALAKTKTPFGMMSSLSTRASAQIAIVQADAELRAARAFLVERVTDMWETVQSGKQASVERRLGLRMAATHATEVAARATLAAYTAGGATAIYSKSPLQRCLRDVQTITQHVFVAPHSKEQFGRVLLGVEPDAPML